MNKPLTKPPFLRDWPDDEPEPDLSKLGPDDAPELTPELAATMKMVDEIPELVQLAAHVRSGGRPALPEAARKQRTTIMLDRDVIEHFRAEGKGWQTRINAALRKAAGL